MEEKKIKHIIFRVEPELHTEIKVLAARRNMSMNYWIVRALTEQIKKERAYDVPKE